MSDDKNIIRNIIKDWQSAMANADVDKIRDFMADDVVYLTPGRPAIHGKAKFMADQKAVLNSMAIQPSSEIKEIQIADNLAYVWQDLKVTIMPKDGGGAFQLSGPVLSIFRKLPDGRWVLFRDANMITPHAQ